MCVAKEGRTLRAFNGLLRSQPAGVIDGGGTSVSDIHFSPEVEDTGTIREKKGWESIFPEPRTHASHVSMLISRLNTVATTKQNTREGRTAHTLPIPPKGHRTSSSIRRQGQTSRGLAVRAEAHEATRVTGRLRGPLSIWCYPYTHMHRASIMITSHKPYPEARPTPPGTSCPSRRSPLLRNSRYRLCERATDQHSLRHGKLLDARKRYTPTDPPPLRCQPHTPGESSPPPRRRVKREVVSMATHL